MAAVSLSLVLAACGSRLEPGEVAGAGGGVGVGGTALDGSGGTLADGSSGLPGSDGSVDGTSGSGDAAGSAGGTTTGGSSAGGGTAAGPGGGGAGTPGGGPEEGLTTRNCDGFQNGPGITDSTITIGNASDVSGPVPGLFEAAQDATKAFVTYFNATNPDGICGRKLELKNYDTGTSDAGDQRSYVDACENVFAMVGSMSAFDSGGAQTAESCGIPDIRSAAVTGNRQACKTCYGAQSTIANQFENAVADYVLKEFPDAAKSAGMLYISEGAAQENGVIQPQAMEARGMDFKYVQGFGTAEFNYAPYVQALKDNDIGYVQVLAGIPQFVRMAQTMQQQNYEPDVMMFDPTAYSSEFIKNGGSAVEGATVFMNFTPFEEASRSPETALYLNWLQQSKPGAVPTFFGVFAWSAARLFVEQAAKLGGDLNRQNMLSAIGKVDNWTANGLHSPQHVGPRRTGDCWRFVQVRGGKWVPVGGTKYRCNGVTVVD